MTRVLVLAAHPDDEVLGMGGTIAVHTDAGDDVRIVVVTDGSKLGAVSDFAVGPLEAVNVLVTDAEVPEPERSALDEAGVRVVTASR